MQNLQSAVAAGKAPALVQIGWSYREYFSNNFSYVEPKSIIEKHFPEDEKYLEEKFLGNILEFSCEQRWISSRITLFTQCSSSLLKHGYFKCCRRKSR